MAARWWFFSPLPVAQGSQLRVSSSEYDGAHREPGPSGAEGEGPDRLSAWRSGSSSTAPAPPPGACQPLHCGLGVLGGAMPGPEHAACTAEHLHHSQAGGGAMQGAGTTQPKPTENMENKIKKQTFTTSPSSQKGCFR